VAAKRMIHFSVGEQGTELFEDGLLLMYGWMAGMGTTGSGARTFSA
jgi:hypothetical protein